MSELRPYVRIHLKGALCHACPVGGPYDKYRYPCQAALTDVARPRDRATRNDTYSEQHGRHVTRIAILARIYTHTHSFIHIFRVDFTALNKDQSYVFFLFVFMRFIFFLSYLFGSHTHRHRHRWGCPRGVMGKTMDCRIVVREFVLQSRY